MQSFVSSNLQAIHHGLRLLELVATSPLGLYTDIKALRESLSVDQEDSPLDRRTFREVTNSPIALALKSLDVVDQALTVLTSMEGLSDGSLEERWVDRAHKVLARAREKIGGDLRQEIAARVKGLYVIVDPEVTNGKPVLEVAEAALKGGVGIIQLRSKAQDKGDLLPTAQALFGLCQQYSALFIANDHADLALSVNSHGLHIGQHDLPLAEARKVLAPSQLIGNSNALMGEALESQAQGADYVAVGSTFPTSTKDNTRPAGLDTLRKVKEYVAPPVVAIGGINESNIEEVLSTGADAICVMSAVTLADDPQDAARRLVRKIEAAQS